MRRRVQSSLNFTDEDDFDPDVVGGLADLGVVNSIADDIEGARGVPEEPLPQIEAPQYEDVRQIPVPGFEDYTEDQLSGISELSELPEPRQMFEEGFEVPENEEMMAIRQRESERLPEAREMVSAGYEPPVNEEIQAIQERDAENERLANEAWDLGYGKQYPDFTLDELRSDIKEFPGSVEEWVQGQKNAKREPTPEETEIVARAMTNSTPINQEVRK